jgi:hypothetical protein
MFGCCSGYLGAYVGTEATLSTVARHRIRYGMQSAAFRAAHALNRTPSWQLRTATGCFTRINALLLFTVTITVSILGMLFDSQFYICSVRVCDNTNGYDTGDVARFWGVSRFRAFMHRCVSDSRVSVFMRLHQAVSCRNVSTRGTLSYAHCTQSPKETPLR